MKAARPPRLPWILPLSLFWLTDVKAAVDFQRQIQPILAEHCLECHGTDKAKGGLAFTSRAAALKELKSGALGVVPGKPAESEILKRLKTSHSDEVMPPPEKAKRPEAREVELLTQWVAEGAPWETHWAYRPVQAPALGARALPAQIDELVQARLANLRIAPSPEADKATLLKRLSYDLLGLPPAEAQRQRFLADSSPGAYAALVEELLASPHFGERWGRHWLDQARYADSDGYEKDNARPDAWRYRDWVIQAVNNDLPLDQFTIEQLAGDLLENASPEQVLATAFHRQTLTNREGGVDQEQYRIEAVFDRTETTGSVWLAHTVGCARCHSHKYDQISQHEYYQLFSFFNNAEETTHDVGTSKAELENYARSHAAHLQKVESLRKAYLAARSPLAANLPDWEKSAFRRLSELEANKAELRLLAPKSVSSEAKQEMKVLADSSVLVGGALPDTDTYLVEFELPEGVVSGLRLEVLPDRSLPKNGPGRNPNGNFVLSRFSVEDAGSGERFALHSAKASAEQEGFKAASVLSTDAATGWAIAGNVGKEQHITFQFVKPVSGEVPRKVRIRMVQADAKARKHVIGRFKVHALLGETPESFLSEQVRTLVKNGSEKWSNEQREAVLEWLVHFDSAAFAAREAFLKAEASGVKPPLMQVRVLGQRKGGRENRVFHRGEFLSPTDPVSPGTPAIFPAVSARDGGTPDRLDLARWLVRPDNPLPARVLANQIWLRLFGEGLVPTVGDFGVRGDPPTHPELLDLLATRLREGAWSRKALIRGIVLSATYRQSSAARADLAEVDPLNRLLARQNRLRVEGEIVRDLNLAAAGLLSAKIGGPSVFPPMPPEIAALSYAGNFRWTESKGEDRYRRGMYTFFKRTAPYPDLITFDCPDANLTSLRRTASNTPLQALTTLNGQVFAEAALALAKRSGANTGGAGKDEERLTRLFQTCLVRAPRPAELRLLEELLRDARSGFGVEQEDAKKFAGDPETAAWTTVARVVLNTDEFITRD